MSSTSLTIYQVKTTAPLDELVRTGPLRLSGAVEPIVQKILVLEGRLIFSAKLNELRGEVTFGAGEYVPAGGRGNAIVVAERLLCRDAQMLVHGSNNESPVVWLNRAHNGDGEKEIEIYPGQYAIFRGDIKTNYLTVNHNGCGVERNTY